METEDFITKCLAVVLAGIIVSIIFSIIKIW